jgi:PKD repeat protein
MKKTLLFGTSLLLLVLVTFIQSCKEDDPDPEVIASFTFALDPNDFRTVIFTNESQNYSTLAWDFDDGSALSTEVNPTHTFAADGEYNVTLTATASSGGKSDTYTKTITITDPDVILSKLTGATSKTWKLLRDVSLNQYPLEVGPPAHNEIWWAFGKNEPLGVRPCMLNDEWTFNRDGSMVFDDKGDYWAEGTIYPEGSNNDCFSSSSPMINQDGADVSAWKSGTHQFELLETGTVLKVKGLGAFIGLQKVATHKEVKVPQEEITFNVISLADGPVDTLIVEAEMQDDAGAATAYWRFVLMHYDDPNAEPPIPGPPPVASFTYTLDGLTATFTNTSENADTYLWDFGDGNSSTEENPVHTYADNGLYTVKLTASNPNGESSYSVAIATSVLTEAVLTNGPWTLQVSGHSIYVGPGMGSDGWWILPEDFLNGAQVGTTDDWSCMADDQFIFSAGGGYEYKTNGGSRNDGYMGTPNGCWSDAEIAASPGAPFGSCNTHTFEFTPAAGGQRALIKVNSGPGFAAFVGFMKGYWGGENTNGSNPPNGGLDYNLYEVMAYGEIDGKEVLVVSVDISAGHDGSAAWTMTLERPIAGSLTEEILTAGPWKLQASGHAVYVGPGMGSDGWWVCPEGFLTGASVGTPDDWSCMTDDEFIFSAGGAYEYRTNGGSRNDGYMGTPNGCWSDAEIAASPGAPFGSCNTHTFTFTPEGGGNNAIITLTNGSGFAAFIGFMKGYWGGENTNGTNPPNGGSATNIYEVISYEQVGGKEIMIVSVDISADHSRSAAWTMVMER